MPDSRESARETAWDRWWNGPAHKGRRVGTMGTRGIWNAGYSAASPVVEMGAGLCGPPLGPQPASPVVDDAAIEKHAELFRAINNLRGHRTVTKQESYLAHVAAVERLALAALGGHGGR